MRAFIPRWYHCQCVQAASSRSSRNSDPSMYCSILLLTRVHRPDAPMLVRRSSKQFKNSRRSSSRTSVLDVDCARSELFATCSSRSFHSVELSQSRREQSAGRNTTLSPPRHAESRTLFVFDGVSFIHFTVSVNAWMLTAWASIKTWT